ncbi:MAG: MBL fold metallo-hydrolase [Chloroflexaceae bacterium]|nr:MBL fold metallo-hydrolase [Chloroflexaceae bacterium]
MEAPMLLTPVDAVEVTVLVDNTMDVLLPGSPVVRRAPIKPYSFEQTPLMAEHGFSLMVTVQVGDRRESIIYDTGLGRTTMVQNMDVLGLNLESVRAIVLSHGHTDHHGGLAGLVERLGRRRMPLVLHPDAWRDRKVAFPNGAELQLPAPNRADLESEGIEVLERRDPSLLLDNLILVTGQVERVTSFEEGSPPGHCARTADGWHDDPWIWDDQAVVMYVRDKGLVVLSGCSHAGIVNVLRYAKFLTRVDYVHAVMGGFHLSGNFFEPRIAPTVQELQTLAPDVIVPSHCTGWKAVHAVARAMPDAFIQTCVGSQFRYVSAN